MPPTVGHYRPNLSNPFNQFSQPPSTYQSNQHQPHNSNFNNQNLGGHGGFHVGQQNQHINIFGSGVQNGTPAGGLGNTGFQSAGGNGLASHEAQMRFAHGAALQQQQQQQQQHENTIPKSSGSGSSRIREVWKSNLDQEFQMIRALVDKYPFVSMDTEFPGIVARPMGSFQTKADYHYQCLRCNVDLLKLIQLGITLWSSEGDVPPPHSDTSLNRYTYPNNLVTCPCTWQFNFEFSLDEDMYSAESIAMLKKSGVDFEKSAEMGIDPKVFGSRLIDSGLVTQENVTWLSFHSGYDFGYLVKVMYPAPMPIDEKEYLSFVKLWFRNVYDIKYLFRWAQRKAAQGQLNQQASDVLAALGSKSGLQDLADELGCHREGRPHTAGSDAWLTGLVFWAMRSKIFNDEIPDEVINKIWGLSQVGPPASAATQAAVLSTPSVNGASLFHSGMSNSTFAGKSDAPTTPQSTNTGVASTPGQHGQGYTGTMGMGAGAFSSNYLYGTR